MGKLFPNGYLSLILTALALLSCDKSSDVPDDSRITFRAKVEMAPREAETKATPVASLDRFYVTASIGLDMQEQQVFGNEPFVRSAASGYYESSRYWPRADMGYHFYASNIPVNFAFKGDFFVDATTGTDVVCAYEPFGEWMAVNNLEFKHILARVGTVTVKPAQLGEGNTDYYTVSDLEIHFTPDTRGHYILGDNLWEKNSSDGVPMNLAASAAALPDSEPFFSQENDIWAVPGRYIAYLNYRVEYEEWFKTYVDAPVRIGLVQGCINDITFELGGDPVDIRFTITVRDWNDVSRNFDFMEP